MDVRIQTSLLAAVVSGALAMSVLLRSRKKRDQWLFGLFGLNMSFWYLTTFLARVLPAPIWSRANLAFGVLLPLSAVEFFRAFMAQTDSTVVRVRRAAWGVAAIIIVAAITPFYDHLVVRTAVLSFVVLFLGSILGMLYVRARKTISRFERGRLYFLTLVGGLAAFFALFEYLPYLGLDLPPFGTLLTLVFLYMLSQSVLRYRLIDLFELAGRLAVLTTLSFVLAGILWVLVLFGGGRYFVQAVVASLVVLVLFDPVRTKVSDQIAQLLFRERYDLEQAIIRLRTQLAHVLEVRELIDILVNGLEQSRRVTHASVYLADEGQQAFRMEGSVGPAPLSRFERAAARPFLDRLQADGVVVLETLERNLEEHRQHGEDREAQALLDVIQSLEAMHASLCVAIRSEEEGILYGWLAIRDERMRDAFPPEEVSLLVGLSRQAAVAIENSRLYKQLKERDRLASLGEMAAGLAHEIRNPLGAIKASAQYLTEGLDDADREFLGIIVEEVDRLNRVVGSFLDYARPAHGNPSPTDINGAVQRTLQLFRPECAEAEIELTWTPTDTLPAVRIDVEQLRQVLINLLRNAMHALEGRESSHIEVSTRIGRDGMVVITVKDNGPGIGDELMPHLFVPFVTTKDRGTGLGLAISQRIASAAGGRLEVRSRSGEGCTFSLRLPPANPLETGHTTEATGQFEASSAGALLSPDPTPSSAPRSSGSSASTARPGASSSAPPRSTPSGVNAKR